MNVECTNFFSTHVNTMFAWNTFCSFRELWSLCRATNRKMPIDKLDDAEFKNMYFFLFILQGIVEFGSRHEQEDAIDKLDDAEFKNNFDNSRAYLRVCCSVLQ